MVAITACIPAMGSHAPRTSVGGPSGNPVRHAMPLTDSIVWANPVRSRQGPPSPKAGMRTMMSSGFSSWTESQVNPNCSITRGV